ncbi:histidine kinase/response regulator fusion protein [Burkholderia lata]|uniref:hybrid sensor histidine kinase/response regulator n=1 Tax=Burkholderia lata (strain ATCC 17760 / DSM 23089 / LMG 22485 / NCIMB 9086 / R18194 / 383) TaxID=482957 RepID=UPI0014537F8A|nr:hybrid sensor histidine kinase/response regulator [Burkholderia lata]VWD54142.1 histidine kinase/response regulator fusion protein [Burkholderia lata]
MQDCHTRDPSTAASDSGSKNAELGLLNRYQRTLLYGGGGVLSIVIACATAYGLWTTGREYIAHQRASFLTVRSLLSVELEMHQTMFSRTVASAEILWTEHDETSRHLVDAFSANGGRIVLHANSRAAPLWVLGELDPGHDASGYVRYLRLAERMSSVMSAAARQIGRPVAGMFYSQDKSFATIYPPERAESLATLFGSTDVRVWIDRLAPASAFFVARADDDTKSTLHSAVWWPPEPDPVTGVPMLRVVQPAFDGRDVFAVFVHEVPAARLRDTLTQHRLAGELMVLDRTGRTVLHSEGLVTHADTTLSVRAMKVGQWRRGFGGLNDAYRDGVFTVSDRVPGTDWVLAYFWSWRTMAAALASDWLVRTGSTAGVLASLWVLLILFDRKVFRPVLARSSHVFESENLNRTIVSLAPVGIGLFALRDGAVLLENDAMRRLRALGGDAGARAVATHYLAMRATGTNAGHAGACEWEYTVPVPGGESIDLAIGMVRARYRSAGALLCVASDITARKRAERAALDAREAADVANRAKTVFLASMSHEMRTPLNAILGHLELLKGAGHDDRTPRRLDTVMRSARGLLSLINDILDISKAESGQMTLELIAFDLRELVVETVDVLAPLASEKAIRFDVTIQGSVGQRYLGDPTRIRQILVNLVGNAIKFTSKGGVTIEVGERRRGHDSVDIALTVGDTGIGIAPDRIDAIFDLFGQADSTISRRFGGTGLGLALCKRHVEMMNGAIAVSSRPGVGSTFRVTLPLKRLRERVERPAVDLPGSHADGDAHTPVRVLAVDDHPFNRELIADQLAALGYAYDVVDGGLAAIRYLLDQRCDVVLTDLNMPDMDGCVLAMCLRDSQPELPVIAMTATRDQSELARCYDAGVVEILAKPLSMSELDKAIRRHVGEAAATSRRQRQPIEGDAHATLSVERHTVLARESRRLLDDMAMAFDDQAFDRLRSGAHAIKGAFAMIREAEVVAACTEIERAAHDSDSAGLRDRLERLRKDLDDALARREAPVAGE